MEINKPKTRRTTDHGLFTLRGLFRLVFAIGAALVVVGAAMLAVAFAGFVHDGSMQVVAMATLVAGGGTLVGAGMIFSSIEEHEAARKPEQIRAAAARALAN